MSVSLDGLPAYYSTRITSARRAYFRREIIEREADRDGVADCFLAQRLATTGTTLPSDFPSRAALVAADVRAVEEVVGAGLAELRSYGLTRTSAIALLLFCERLTMTTFAYSPRIGQFYEEDEVSILASAARTASVTSDIYEVGDKGTLRLDLAVTAVSGTAPTLHCQIETRKAYSAGTWRVVDAFGISSAAATERRTMSGCDRFIRAVCTIAGSSPSFTFSLTGEAV